MKRTLSGLDKGIRSFLPAEATLAEARGLEFLRAGFLNAKHTVDSDGRLFLNSLLPSFPGASWNRFFEAAGRMHHGERVPLWLDIVTTGRCHCRCWHCFRSKYPDRSDLSLDAAARVIQEAFDMGTVMVGITGGEPMLRHDLLDMMRLVPDGMEISLYTTGHLMDDEFIRMAEATRLTRCVVSLDHFDPRAVDARRNRRGAFEEAAHAVAELGRSRIFTSAALCITEDLCTEDAFRRYLDLVCSLGVDEVRVILPVPQGRLQGENFKKLYVDARRLVRKVREQTARDESVPGIMLFSDFESASCFGCGAGFHYLSVNNDGAVTPCVAVPLAFGTIHESSLREIYSSMGEYFMSTGSTCLGRRLGAVLRGRSSSPGTYPYSVEHSKELADRCIVQGRQGSFFRYVGAPACEEDDSRETEGRERPVFF